MNRILIVDDDEMLREAYSLILSAAGYSVATAYDGENALKQYGLLPPDLILLDMVMPNLDGVGFLERLNLIGDQLTVKVIIFSNLSTSEKVNEAMMLGAIRHITKSQMTPQQLVGEIKALLA